MNYYSHSKTLPDGTVVGSKLLYVHTQGVLDKALHHWYEGVEFGFDKQLVKDLLEDIVRLHDLGKYTPYFQNYLLQRPPIDNLLKQHARFGSYAAYHRWLEREEPKFSIVALLLIFRHHSYLFPLRALMQKLEDANNQKIFSEQLKSVIDKLPIIQEDARLKGLKEVLHYPSLKTVRKLTRVWEKREANIRDYYFCNYLFSLLIEGDKLDASETRPYQKITIGAGHVDQRFGKPLLDDKTGLTELSQNEVRNFCRAEVVSHLEREDILNYYIFTLTAPTGIGKTMTALDFALKLKVKIRAQEGHEAQIIYALPFINIIEQALQEYEETLSESEANILGHYQFADVFGDQEDGDEEQYHQKLMKLDTWQSDVVITSFVQFFETLICNRNKLLKKFNHYAGSIIILDEVQTLRLDQMPLIGAALFFLAKFLRSRIILMTATKPKIFELAEAEILSEEGEKVHPLELLTSHESVFALFNRTAIHPLLTALEGEPEERIKAFVSDLFASSWDPSQSCIIVCNTVRSSITLFETIEQHCKDKGLSNPIFYLSTNIAPIERLGRIKAIKTALENAEAPILVATQVVEAGVDLDFDAGFRDLGPVDSMVQVAGRINRHNDEKRKGAPLHIIDFGECQKIYGKLTTIQARSALEGKEIIPESEYLELITRYFDGISGRSSFSKARKFFNSMKTLNYDAENREECPVSAFRIIEQSGDYRSVFIELDENSRKLRQSYFKKIVSEIPKEEFDKRYKRAFQQHIISVPKLYTNGLEAINQFDENILVVPLELLSSYYDPNTGFKRETDSKGAFMF